MRVIEAFDNPVRALAVSPDGRFVAAASRATVTVWYLLSGEKADGIPSVVDRQLAFTSDGKRLLFISHGQLQELTIGLSHSQSRVGGQFAGGIAVSPDGRTLVATQAGRRQQVRLEKWEIPSWRSTLGFDFWSPFVRLAFSPNGEFLAGIDSESFELRIAVTGGLNGRHRLAGWAHTLFLAFARDSQTVVFGRDTEYFVMETRGGAVVRRLVTPGNAIADAVVLGSGRQLAIVDGTSLIRLWSTESWEVDREYDWQAGGLTCLAATADGLAGVCGTDTGRIVVFDVDE